MGKRTQLHKFVKHQKKPFFFHLNKFTPTASNKSAGRDFFLSRGVDDAAQEKEQPPPSHCKNITTRFARSLSIAGVSSLPREAHALLTLQSSFWGEERGAQQGEMRFVLTLSN